MDILAYAAAVAAAKKNGGGGSSGGGSGADLLNADGKIKQEVLPEGYPYVSKGEVVYVPEQTLTSEDGFTGDVIIPEAGQTVIVTYCGVDYECVMQGHVVEGISVIYCGDGTQMGFPSSSEPFFLLFMPGYMNGILPATEEPPEVMTVKVVGFGETVTKMDAKFLPNAVIPAASLLEVGTINSIINQEISMDLHNALMRVAETGYGKIEYEVLFTEASGNRTEQYNNLMTGVVEVEGAITRAKLYGFYPYDGIGFIGVIITSAAAAGQAFLFTTVYKIAGNPV